MSSTFWWRIVHNMTSCTLEVTCVDALQARRHHILAIMLQIATAFIPLLLGLVDQDTLKHGATPEDLPIRVIA